MPEGPEVRKNAMDLAGSVSGKMLIDINVTSGRYAKKEPSNLQVFKLQLPIRIVGAGCHGKFMYILCADEWSIWTTLGMTGQWGDKPTKYTRIELCFNDKKVFFNDMRNFGTIKFMHSKFEFIKKLQSLGPDMLAEDVSDEKFIVNIRKKSDWTLAKVLMDQGVIAGVGNYIKSDSLWLARLSPHRLVSETSDGELAVLNNSIKRIMRESFSHGGATISDYRQFNGDEGEYNHNFLVYNQETDIDGNPVVRETTTDNRTTHWVPTVQL